MNVVVRINFIRRGVGPIRGDTLGHSRLVERLADVMKSLPAGRGR